MIGFMLATGRRRPGRVVPPAPHRRPRRVDAAGGGRPLSVTHEHGKGDCAVRGSASDLLLYLWTRKPAADLEVFGDAELAAAWGRLTP